MNKWAEDTRHERKRLGLTLDQCARHIGCSVPRYSAIERGIDLPTQQEVAQIARYFRQCGGVASDSGKPAIITEATTDEVAGWTLERWSTICPETVALLTPEQYHGLRECVLFGIRTAVEMDRDGRLEYSECDKQALPAATAQEQC